MANVTLGRTGIVVEQNGFGALPIQRVGFEEAGKLLNRALDGGMNLIDTARAYSDSEEKIGRAIAHRRQEYTLATKTGATTPEASAAIWIPPCACLRPIISIFISSTGAGQCYRPDDGTGMYECMLEAKRQGKILHVAATAHKIGIAEEMVDSGLYECMPVSLQLSGGRARYRAGGALQAAGCGLYRHEGAVGRADQQFPRGLRLHCPVCQRGGHLGRAARLGTGGVFELYRQSARHDGGYPRADRS